MQLNTECKGDTKEKECACAGSTCPCDTKNHIPKRGNVVLWGPPIPVRTTISRNIPQICPLFYFPINRSVILICHGMPSLWSWRARSACKTTSDVGGAVIGPGCCGSLIWAACSQPIHFVYGNFHKNVSTATYTTHTHTYNHYNISSWSAHSCHRWLCAL